MIRDSGDPVVAVVIASDAAADLSVELSSGASEFLAASTGLGGRTPYAVAQQYAELAARLADQAVEALAAWRQLAGRLRP